MLFVTCEGVYGAVSGFFWVLGWLTPSQRTPSRWWTTWCGNNWPTTEGNRSKTWFSERENWMKIGYLDKQGQDLKISVVYISFKNIYIDGKPWWSLCELFFESELNRVQLPNSLGHRTLLAGCNNCGQICTNLGHEREQTGVNAGSYWPATNSAERENFRNGLLFSFSARCILLTNYCGASFSSWHTSTETSKVTSDEKVPLSEFCIAVLFGTGPLGHNILAVKIFLVWAFSQICASSSGTGLFFPGELPADDSINLCPATVAHNSNQSLGSHFQKPEHQTRQQVSIIVSNHQGQIGPGMTPFRSENRWHSQRPQEDRVALRKWCQAGLAKKSTLAALDARRRCLLPEKRLGLHTKIQRSRLTRSNLKRDLSSSLSWIKRQVAYQELVPLIKWRRRWGHRGMKYKHKKKHLSCYFFVA